MYEVMRYWDEDRPEWVAEEHDFAAAWRNQPKWVVSRSLKSVGPNATLVEDDIEAVIRGLKAQLVGEAFARRALIADVHEYGSQYMPSTHGFDYPNGREISSPPPRCYPNSDTQH